jgi:flagellar motor switch protein FliN/FliY
MAETAKTKAPDTKAPDTVAPDTVASVAEAPSPGTAAGDGSETALFQEIGESAAEAAGARGIEAMLGVRMDVHIVLGHARMPIAELLKLGRGSVVELDRRIGEPVDVVVNDMLVARGNLVQLAGERIGVTLTEIMRNPASGA